MNKILLKYLAIISLVVLFLSCGSPEEGCLEVTATNFDVSADVNCANCCTYPSLSLRVNHVYDTLGAFSLDNVYLDAVDSPFTASKVQMYLSNVVLIDAAGDSANVTDLLSLTFADSTQAEVANNFVLLKKDIGTYSTNTIGNISTSGSFTKIRFYVGVVATANHALTSAMPSDHPLATQSDTMHLNTTDGYIFQKMAIQTDTSSTILTTYEIYGDANLVMIELDYPQTIEAGFDVSLAIDLDYSMLFDDIAFQQDDAATVTSKLRSNIANAFSVAQ